MGYDRVTQSLDQRRHQNKNGRTNQHKPFEILPMLNQQAAQTEHTGNLLVPINLVDGNLLSHRIGSETVTVSGGCKILGKELDSKLPIKSSENNMKRSIQHHSQARAKHVGLKWGLSPKKTILHFWVFSKKFLHNVLVGTEKPVYPSHFEKQKWQVNTRCSNIE